MWRFNPDAELIEEAVRWEHGADPDPKTVLGRSLDRLETITASRRIAAEQAKADAEIAARIAAMTPEQIEQSELQKVAIRIGLTQGVPIPAEPNEVREFVARYR